MLTLSCTDLILSNLQVTCNDKLVFKMAAKVIKTRNQIVLTHNHLPLFVYEISKYETVHLESFNLFLQQI